MFGEDPRINSYIDYITLTNNSRLKLPDVTAAEPGDTLMVLKDVLNPSTLIIQRTDIVLEYMNKIEEFENTTYKTLTPAEKKAFRNFERRFFGGVLEEELRVLKNNYIDLSHILVPNTKLEVVGVNSRLGITYPDKSYKRKI
ncbi:MAG TPA: hypothetical protein PKG93_01025 [Bacilli bacterium]|nr:hypothetical protein [Bacilli bacterium]HPZ24024.1 hypothetical protein [Bacilli bacterium]